MEELQNHDQNTFEEQRVENFVQDLLENQKKGYTPPILEVGTIE